MGNYYIMCNNWWILNHTETKEILVCTERYTYYKSFGTIRNINYEYKLIHVNIVNFYPIHEINLYVDW